MHAIVDEDSTTNEEQSIFIGVQGSFNKITCVNKSKTVNKEKKMKESHLHV